jgi:hypothetical protein
MEQSPSSDANSHPDGQEINCLLWNPQVHYRIHNNPPLVPILSQMHPVHTHPPYFPKTLIILSSHLSLVKSSGIFFFRFTDQNFVCISHLSHACHMPLQSHLHWLLNHNNILWSAKDMKLLITQSSPVSRNFLPLTSKYSPQHPVITPPTLCSPLVWETKFHTHI